MKKKRNVFILIACMVLLAGVSVTYAALHKSYEELIEQIYVDIPQMNLSKAYLECQKAISMEPDRMEGYEAYAVMLAAKGDYAQTEEQLKKGIKIGRELLQEKGYVMEGISEGIHTLAQYYIQWNRTEDAIELLRAIPSEFESDKTRQLLEELVGKKVIQIQDYEIEWVDEQMEKAVRKLIGKMEDPVRASDVWEITSLEIWGDNLVVDGNYVSSYDADGYFLNGEYICERGNIQSLMDLRHFENLEEISINFQQNLELDFFETKQLTRLRKMSFVSDGLREIDSLMWVNGLTELVLDYNDIMEFMWVSRMERLNILRARGNQAFLSTELFGSMEGLRYLDVSNISRVDLERISELPELEELKIENSGDMTLLGDCVHLKKLTITCDTSVIRFIKQIKGLTELRITLTETSDISGFADMLYLQRMELSNAGDEEIDLQVLSQLPSLKEVSLVKGDFFHYSYLARCKSLEKIRLPYGNKEIYEEVVRYFPDEQIELCFFGEH